MTAVEVVVENLKKMSKQVSTPEEIAQVSQVNYFMNKLTISEEIALVIRSSKNLNYTLCKYVKTMVLQIWLVCNYN